MILAVLAGIFAAGSILAPPAWFIGIVGVALFARSLYALPREGHKRAIARGWIFGAAYTVTSLAWFYEAMPLDWIGISGISVYVIVIGLWIFAFFLGSFFVPLALAIHRFRSSALADSLLAASMWVLAQYLQMWGFAIFTMGDASLLGPHFSAIMIGNSLASFSPLLQLAALGGVHLLSFIVVMLGFLLYHALANISHRPVQALVIPVALLAMYVLTTIDREHPFVSTAKPSEGIPLRTALVTANLPPEPAKTPDEQRARAKAHENLVREWAASNTPPDLLVFPEDSEVFSGNENRVAAFNKEVFPDADVAIIDSGTALNSEGRKFVRMYFYRADGSLEGTYDKLLLVPQGEFAPALYSLILRALRGTDDTAYSERVGSLQRGDRVHVAKLMDRSIGALFCSDILSPYIYRALTKDGATMLINAASQSWFRGSRIVDDLVLSIAKIRAVENGRYLAIAGNGVSSTIISDRGEVLARSLRGADSILVGSLYEKNDATPFVRFGNWILALSIVIPFGIWIRRRKSI